MAPLVPLFLALFGVMEPLRVYLGFSGNLQEKVGAVLGVWRTPIAVPSYLT